MPIKNNNTEENEEVEQEQSDASLNVSVPSQSERTPLGAKDFAVKVAKSIWAYIKGARVELIVLVALFALDLITKALIGHFMELGDSIRLIPNFLYITYVRNTKAAFGSAFGLEKVLSDDAIRIIFLLITVIAVGVFFYLMVRCRKRHILMRLAFAMIIAGALGNFYDRLVLHYVRDFVEIVFWGCDLPLLGTTFPVFNIADAALTVGVVLFIIYFIVFFKDPKPQEKEAEETPQASEPDKAENSIEQD
ncbi:MAG: signal peptidase II, partial [Clostridiales bacterium]|nr:signal peptidase II [Clostridiales bacterium]